MILVTVYDSKADSYTPPHPSQNDSTAVREFATLVNDGGKSMISQHPEDFSIFRVGEWFERVPIEGQDGRFCARLVADSTFSCLARANDLVKKG